MNPTDSCMKEAGGAAGKRQLCLANELEVTPLWHGARAKLGEQDGFPHHGGGSSCCWEQREHLLSSSHPLSLPFPLLPGGSAGLIRYGCLSCHPFGLWSTSAPLSLYHSFMTLLPFPIHPEHFQSLVRQLARYVTYSRARSQAVHAASSVGWTAPTCAGSYHGLCSRRH